MDDSLLLAGGHTDFRCRIVSHLPLVETQRSTEGIIDGRLQIADGSMITRFVPLQEVIFVIVSTCSSFSVICVWLIGSRHAQLPPSLSNKSITDVMLSDSVLASTALLFVESAVIRRSYVVVGSFVSAHAVYN